jgi:hypothetical protein
MTRLLRSDERIAGLPAALAYHVRVKPPQDEESRLALKDRTASTRIGA